MRHLENQSMPVLVLTEPDEHQEDIATGQKLAASKKERNLLSWLQQCKNQTGKALYVCWKIGRLGSFSSKDV